jgi:hypothetical protein
VCPSAPRGHAVAAIPHNILDFPRRNNGFETSRVTNRQPVIIHNTLAVARLTTFGLLMTFQVWAQSGSEAVGELASANQAAINDSPAISGATIFNNNRVNTAQRGTAIINLGKLGRVELGAGTELILRLSAGQLGGELRSGRVVMSARAGVVVSITTSNGLIATDGRQAATLAVEIDPKQARVIAHRGEARVVSGGRAERVGEGEELVTGQIAKPVAATASQSIPTFASLVITMIKQSIARLASGKARDADQRFDTTTACRDRYSNKCRRRGDFSP